MKTLLLSLLMLLPFAGVISGNILGDMRNKSAGVVFFMWKGIQVFRKYVSDISNPQSVAQTAQRNAFTSVLRVAQAILVPIIQVYWKRFAIKKSEFNAFMSHQLKDATLPLTAVDLDLVIGQHRIEAITPSVVSMTSLELDPLGTDIGLTMDFANAYAVWVNLAQGEVGIDGPEVTNLVNPMSFANPANTDGWSHDDVSVHLFFTKATIVDAKDFTSSQCYAATV